MIRIILSLSFVLIFCSAIPDDYVLVNSISFPQKVILSTDNLGNAYVVVENQLLKFDLHGNPLSNYSENNQGTIRSIDVTNPLKILLFYPDFAKMVVLDSKLSYQSSIDFRSLKINQPLTICNSSENGYWVYDREDDQLKKIDINLQVVHQSGPLTQTIGYQVQPGKMIEGNGFIYMNNPQTGILVFDRFGAYYKTIPYQNIENFQIVEKEILFVFKNKFVRYDSKSVVEKEILIPSFAQIRDARIEQNQLYLLTSDSLKFYSF